MTPEPVVPPAKVDEQADDAALLDELRRAVRSTLERAWSPAAARAGLDSGEPAFDRAFWATVRELGWVDLLVPADDGGGGAGAPELCVLAEELGRAEAAVPLASAAVGAALVGSPTDDRLTVFVEGPAALRDGDGDGDGAAGKVVHGRWIAVPFGAVADRFVIAAGAGDDEVLVVVDAAATERQDVVPLDRTPAATLTIDARALAATTILATGPDAAARRGHADRLVLLARAAELVGVAAAANAAAVGYARERITFGRPIGTYQAISHRLVDQRADIEIARALVGRAARALHEGIDDAGPFASLAAFWAQDTLRAVTEGAIQVFGGIGYTWEDDAHVHLRRAACLAASLGDRSAHRDEVVDWIVAPRR